MRRVVLDASVVVKWALPDRAREDDVPRALALLDAFTSGRLAVVEPPHWLAETAAVLTRLDGPRAREKVLHLAALELPVRAEPEIYAEACRLGRAFGQHVFDTLYHAVALGEDDGVLITADHAYYRKARSAGRVVRLREFAV